jgi:hypothetical protein
MLRSLVEAIVLCHYRTVQATPPGIVSVRYCIHLETGKQVKLVTAEAQPGGRKYFSMQCEFEGVVQNEISVTIYFNKLSVQFYSEYITF